MNRYRKKILDSGITVITEEIPSSLSVIIGFYVTSGSRDESRELSGISHFIEHSVFKGTKNRNEREIASSIESRGGYINASTSREWTAYYAQVLPEEISLAVDVVSDLVDNPLFRKEAVEMERFVIQDEIKRFNDSPESLLFFHALKSSFGDKHPLSSPILGTPETVKKINDGDIRRFWDENYTTKRIYVSAVGKINHDSIYELIQESLVSRRNGNLERKEEAVQSSGLNLVQKPELNHEYVALSSSSFPYNNNERFPFLVLLSILGMGMSSRLFQKLRQEMGLVYNVSAFSEFFSDTGIYGIYFSTDRNKLQKTLDTVRDVLENLSFSREETDIAKERIKGNILISLEDIDNRMSRNVKEEIYLGEHITIPELLERIEQVQLEDVDNMKKKYFEPGFFDITLLGRSEYVNW